MSAKGRNSVHRRLRNNNDNKVRYIQGPDFRNKSYDEFSIMMLIFERYYDDFMILSYGKVMITNL